MLFDIFPLCTNFSFPDDLVNHEEFDLHSFFFFGSLNGNLRFTPQKKKKE